ncbi:nicotinate-nucleotide adenylyltransferase [Anaerolineae bacterium]|nr:nicotinate-nucleotide adenylyltransferase [Anaerolineae bacterium]
MTRIGVFGGTFDPPHLGHLIVAECAADVLNLSVVLFTPAADPPHKADRQITPAQHRKCMVELAIQGNDHFKLSEVDLNRPGPQYTVDTLRLIAGQYPHAELYFIMGGDSLSNFLSWHDPAGIIAQAQLALIQRPGSRINIAALDTRLPGLMARCVNVDAPEVGLAATDLRDDLRMGRSVRYRLTDSVIAYIDHNQLYRD